jgi:uncharacterized membrane protein HdeD (DUF308 family)
MAKAFSEEAKAVRRNFGWFLMFGIVQVVVGIVAISFAYSATLASVLMLGIVLCVGAGAQLAAAIFARDWKGFFLFLLLGILYAVVGMLTVSHPLVAAEALTLMLATVFLIAGAFRIAVALGYRFPSWGWVALNGGLTVVLGILIAAGWPESSIWVIGMFVGIELVVNGATWTVLAIGGRQAMKPLVER